MESLLLTIFAVSFLVLTIETRQIDGRLKQLDRRLSLILKHLNIDPLAEVQLSERVQALARDPSRKVEALKAYRQETGAGLREAKEAIEAFLKDRR